MFSAFVFGKKCSTRLFMKRNVLCICFWKEMFYAFIFENKCSLHLFLDMNVLRVCLWKEMLSAFVFGGLGPSILGDFEVPIEHFAAVVHRFNVLLLPSNARGKIVSAHNTPGPAAGQNRGAFMFHVHLEIPFSLQPQKSCGAVNVLFAPEFL